MGHFKRLSGWHFPRELLSSRVTAALLQPRPLHLSPCLSSSFIYCKASDKHGYSAAAEPTRSHTLTRTQTYASALARMHVPRFWLVIRAKQTLLWARLFVWFLPIVLSQHTLLIFAPDCSLCIIRLLSSTPVRSREKAIAWVWGGSSNSILLINAFGVPHCSFGPGSMNRLTQLSFYLHLWAVVWTSRSNTGRLSHHGGLLFLLTLLWVLPPLQFNIPSLAKS